MVVYFMTGLDVLTCWKNWKMIDITTSCVEYYFGKNNKSEFFCQTKNLEIQKVNVSQE